MTAPRSLTRRLALIFGLFVALVLLLAGLVMERSVAVHFDELDVHDLDAKAGIIQTLLARPAPDMRADHVRARLDEPLSAMHADVAVMLRRAPANAGDVVYARNADVFDGVALDAEAPGAVRKWSRGERRFIGYRVPVSLPGDARDDAVAWIALDISHHVSFLQSIRWSLLVAVVIVALVAAGLGGCVAHRGLAPLRRVTATARGLSADRLGERLSVADAPAEVRELVDAFNGMLDRLEAAFGRLNDYSADIAHELRTPISNLMTETEVALSRTRDAAAYRETLHSNLEECERLARMISDMLFLAQADHDSLPRRAEPIVLEDEAGALAEFYEALADEYGVRIDVHGHGRVTGDRLMLQRALSNLLSNALRHAEPGSAVRIVIEQLGSSVRLAVCNRGAVIAPEELERVFERFHRVERTPGSKGEGAGLGLAITRSIVKAHRGRIAVRSVPDETVFSIELPAVLPDGPAR